MNADLDPLAFEEGFDSLDGNEPDDLTSLSFVLKDGHKVQIAVSCSQGPNRLYAYEENKKKWKDVADSVFRDEKSATQLLVNGHFLGTEDNVFYSLNAEQPEGLKHQRDKILFCRSSDPSFQVLETNLHQKPLNPFVGLDVQVLDVDGSGQHAFFVVNDGAPFRLFLYSQDYNEVIDLSEEVLFKHPDSAQISAAGLFSISPFTDLLVGHLHEDLDYYLFESNGSELLLALRDLHQGAFYHFPGIRGLVPIDLNGNSLADWIVLPLSGSPRVFFQSPEGFVDCTPPFFFQYKGISHVVPGDFDNDGRDEFFFCCEEDENFMLRYLGNQEWEPVPILNPDLKRSMVSSCIVGDFFQTGFLGLCLLSGEDDAKKLKLFSALANSNSWVRILPLSPTGGAAFGAKIQVSVVQEKTKVSTYQTRYVQSGGTVASQHEPFAHFGLGLEPAFFHLIIQWPHSFEDLGEPRILQVENLTLFNQTICIPHPENMSETLG